MAHHAFWSISLPKLHEYYVKVANFTFCGGRREHKTTTFFFFSLTLIQYSRKKNCQHLTNCTGWNKGIKFDEAARIRL